MNSFVVNMFGDIVPNALVDFTNSLLLSPNSKWLLIFDNVTGSKSIKIPKRKALKHHIIITTRGHV